MSCLLYKYSIGTNGPTQASKRLSIKRLPPVLSFQFKVSQSSPSQPEPEANIEAHTEKGKDSVPDDQPSPSQPALGVTTEKGKENVPSSQLAPGVSTEGKKKERSVGDWFAAIGNKLSLKRPANSGPRSPTSFI